MPPHHRTPAAFAAPLLGTLLLATLPAQVERLELGLRLRDFERHLAACERADLRKAALQEVETAVQAFFRLDTRAVALAIDRADQALAGREWPAVERFARSLQLTLAARLVDAGGPGVECTLASAYDPGVELPGELGLQLVLGPQELPAVELAVSSLPMVFRLPVAKAPTGDQPIRWRVLDHGKVLTDRTQGLTIVRDLAKRLDRLEAAVETDPRDDAGRTLETASLAGLVRQLRGMTRKRAEETLLPGSRLLEEAEALAAAVATNHPYYGREIVGQHWLRVPLRSGTAVLRFQAPAVTDGSRRPLVLALHGAGGSENLFFDGYGDGLVARLAADRGWFVAAPRSGGLTRTDLPALIDALAARWPIDPEQVLVVGHSMGAAEAVASTTARPGRFRAVAALGGGGAVAKQPGLEGLPFFVGTGSRDFLRGQAQALHRRLGELGVPSTFREYPDVEHLTVVQFALNDVFAFFASALARPSGH